MISDLLKIFILLSAINQNQPPIDLYWISRVSSKLHVFKRTFFRNRTFVTIKSEVRNDFRFDSHICQSFRSNTWVAFPVSVVARHTLAQTIYQFHVYLLRSSRQTNQKDTSTYLEQYNLHHSSTQWCTSLQRT